MRGSAYLLVGFLGFLDLLLWSLHLIVAVHGCPEGTFQCASHECVTQDNVCDYHNDCSDGSDEEFCGSCDFDLHTCGWKDVSGSSFKWRREMANVSSEPGVDHTTGSRFGGVAHVEGSEPSLLSKAQMETILSKATAIGCRITFWYHLFDSTGLSSEVSLHVITISSTKKVWEVKKVQTTGWESATVYIGNRPANSKLVFMVSPTFIGDQDVALDDVQLLDCAEQDIPTGSSRLTCSFEEDACAWYMDQGSPASWEHARGRDPWGQQLRPDHDHTTGTGYYMFVGSKSKTAPPLVARLMSYPQDARKTQCVSFWYHMYGGNVGFLKFISRYPGGVDRLEWMRTGTQGNKWHFVDLQIPESDSPVQFVFEAMGGAYGSIAIDDVTVSVAPNGSCPTERECTFQGSFCGLLNDPTGNFNWTRTTGELSVNTSSPSHDHTLGTTQGFYLSTQIWRWSPGHTGRMLTRLHDPTPKSGECLKFWYHMEGEGAGTLSVYLQKLHGSRVILWSAHGNQGDLWRQGWATVLSHDTPYQIVLEAIAGDSVGKDIALDDLLMLNRPCPPQGFCDFEMDPCGWVSVRPPVKGMDWDWTSASSANSGRAPPLDHTTNSGQGHYMYYSKTTLAPLTKAYLQSEYLDATSAGCLVFWYHVFTFYHDDVSFMVHVNESSSLRFIWKHMGNKGNVWLKSMVDYSTSNRYQILFEAGSRSNMAVDIALDDIYIVTDQTCADLIATTAAPTTEPATAPGSPMDCNFDDGLCHWSQEAGDSFDWNLQTGLEVNSPEDGPGYDHSLGNRKGFYLLVPALGTKDGETAVISIPMMLQSTDVCISFWYQMLGSSISSLELLVQTNESEMVVWTRQGTQDAEWLNAQVTISIADVQKVKLSGRRTAVGSGYIAVDDITAREGCCMSQGDPCGFEDPSLCEYEQDVNDGTDWVHTTGPDGQVDHTYWTQLGHSMGVFGEDLHQRGVAMLRTPEYPATTESCLQFWYWLAAHGNDSLSVHVTQSEELGPALWVLSGTPCKSWEVAQVTVSSPSRFRVVFKAEMDAISGSLVQLDEVSLRAGACVPTGSCDFEKSQCTWRNVDNDGHDWIQADGHFHRPSLDHTTQTPEGRYLLSSFQNQMQNQSSRAVLVSERFQNSGTTCLSFWYHMNVNGSAMLRVYLRSGATQDDHFLETTGEGGKWTHVSHTVLGPKGFQVLIEAESRSTEFVAIDDLLVTPGPCHDNETSANFTGCDFETDTCDWDDISLGQFLWHRSRNGSGMDNTGPSTDHTTGTELGWYMEVDMSLRDINSYAALQSPIMKEASSQCLLEFYYHMYGEGIGQLRVLLHEGSRFTPLWSLSGDQGAKWVQASVGVGRIPGVFRLVFEATRTYSILGDIAIDDISLLNCSLPEPQAHCPQDTFQCSHGVCVEPSRVCDFTDDCGDRSDETDCELQGYLERCSFESGLCGWQQSGLGTPGADWVWQNAEVAPPNLAPPRDHTRNSAVGHYVIAGLHLSEGETSEMVSSTLLPSLNCTVRFYHYSQGVGLGSEVLTVRLRTVINASSDRVLWVREVSRGFFWERSEVTFSSAVHSKVVLRYERPAHAGGGMAVDDVSFSPQCCHDPENSLLPQPATPTALPSITPSATPCKSDEFFCWLSENVTCIHAGSQCDYIKDCPLEEDEQSCGPCTFESGQCGWEDVSKGAIRWQRQRAEVSTDPDHTTDTGHYMGVNLSQGESRGEARLLSPKLPPSSPYCQMLFHFRVAPSGQAGLDVFLQETGVKSKTPLWSRPEHNSGEWVPEIINVGPILQRYRIVFSSPLLLRLHSGVNATSYVALDDISFHNCEASYQPPAPSSHSCSFEEHSCSWVQAANDDLDWERWSGLSETANTGPTGDHTTGSGKYLYVKSSSPNRVGDVAQLKSPLLPPAGNQGYCITFWYHMFGATVGALKLYLQKAPPLQRMLVWKKQGVQSDLWQMAQSHVTLQEVHQVVLEASVGGRAGDIALDDINLIPGVCPQSDLCDFEEDDCGWTSDGWIRHAGVASHTEPRFDHTTETIHGKYFYLNSSRLHPLGHMALLTSPQFPAEKGNCLQVWYHMFGDSIKTLNVYQQGVDGSRSLVFSKTGNQGALWRLMHVRLDHIESSAFKIVVEAVQGSGVSGGVAIDDVLLSPGACPPPGGCDFQAGWCRWTNIVAGDQADWLRGRGDSPISGTGPHLDHSMGSSQGFYVYVDSAAGQKGDLAKLYSEIFHPAQGESCFSFWYHRHGQNVGNLTLYSSTRITFGEEEQDLALLWMEAGNQEDTWLEGTVDISNKEPFWFVFVYQRGESSLGHIALDDLQLITGSCPTPPASSLSSPAAAYIGLGSGLLFAIVLGTIVSMVFLQRSLSCRRPSEEDRETDNIIMHLHDYKLDELGTTDSFKKLPNPPSDVEMDILTAISEA